MSEIATKPKVESFPLEAYQKAQNLDTLKRMGKGIEAAVAEALPSFMRKQAPAMLRACYTELQKTPKLMNCTPMSIFGSVIQAGQMGLMLGGALGQAYLIPFKSVCNLVPGYKGYIQLVNRSGQVGVINAETVWDKDVFKRTMGSDPKLIHEPGDYPTVQDVANRKAVAYYATVQTKMGTAFRTLTKAEAEFHKNKHALSDKTWNEHFDAMAMKTCIIKLCKYLPMSAEVQSAIFMDEMMEAGETVDASFLFQDALEAADPAAGGTAGSSPQKERHDDLRDRLGATRKPVDELAEFVERLEKGGLWPDFCAKYNALPEEVEHAKNGKRTEWIGRLKEYFTA